MEISKKSTRIKPQSSKNLIYKSVSIAALWEDVKFG
jgi:hypothetical protein